MTAQPERWQRSGCARRDTSRAHARVPRRTKSDRTARSLERGSPRSPRPLRLPFALMCQIERPAARLKGSRYDLKGSRYDVQGSRIGRW